MAGIRRALYERFRGLWTVRSAADKFRDEIAGTNVRSLEEQLTGRQLSEDTSVSDLWSQDFLNLLDRSLEFGGNAYFFSNYADRQYGRYYPFFINEQQLALLRAHSRWIATKNSYALGLLTGLTSYVIGPGFTYRATSTESPKLADRVQKEIDAFAEANDWADLQQDLFVRSRVDGEIFLRQFIRDGVLSLRIIGPEQIMQYPGSDYREFSFGIRTEPEDALVVYGYWIHALDSAGPSAVMNAGMGEEVVADDILHFKINTPRGVKRGLPDFSYELADALRAASKIRGNAGEGAALQAGLAQIRQWEVASMSSVQNFAQSQVDFTQANPISQKTTNFQQVAPGRIEDIPRGMEYVAPPGWQPGVVENYVTILHAQLRAAGVRWNAPEWLPTASGADMAAFTASLTAESPFLKTMERYQDSYVRFFKRVISEAIGVAIDQGRLPEDTLQRVELQIEPPSIEARNPLQEAQANQIAIMSGYKSPQTCAAEAGLDFETEQEQREEFAERNGGMAGALPDYGEGHDEEIDTEPQDRKAIGEQIDRHAALLEEQTKRRADMDLVTNAVRILMDRRQAPASALPSQHVHLEMPAKEISKVQDTVAAGMVRVLEDANLRKPDTVASWKKDANGEICEVTYASGRVVKVVRDASGRQVNVETIVEPGT